MARVGVLAARLSRSQPPRLGRSRRSRLMRSASPTGHGAHSPGFGACRGRRGTKLPVGLVTATIAIHRADAAFRDTRKIARLHLASLKLGSPEGLERGAAQHGKSGEGALMDKLVGRLDIRLATPEDAAAIWSVQAEGWMATYPNEGHGITRDGLRRHLEGGSGEKIASRVVRIKERIESEASGSAGAQDFVALLDGETVGFTCPFIEPSGRRRVGALYVLPSVQRLGIGHLLLERNLAWHGEDHDVYLNVAAYNTRAIRFYERHGFVLTGEEGHDEVAMVGDVRIPELEMMRRGRQRLAHDPDS